MVVLFIVMWDGMIGTTLNSDPIRSVNLTGVFGLIAVFRIAVALAMGRLHGWSSFTFPHARFFANLAWHVFLLTCILFICYLACDGLVQILVLIFGAPVFEGDCGKISERDTALFVWDAMAKGAFKFLAGYLHIPAEACPPSTAG
ncbi:hypothetical protein [Hyphomicrobium denitrificans]|uniref:hypothetical protein n=1 Tax=Hyphomicrobium denitrificans TaxID=53399 RepID=UPI0002F88334|nr:hypothetical protein [Hyphomicrobium denitrificans]